MYVCMYLSICNLGEDVIKKYLKAATSYKYRDLGRGGAGVSKCCVSELVCACMCVCVLIWM
jgi:hypothetical protein